MTILKIPGGAQYGVEFRHRTQKLSRDQKRIPGFGDGVPIKALTTCVILEVGGANYMGIGSAICALSDDFSRRTGMQLAFAEAVKDCKLFNGPALLRAFRKEWPVRPHAEPAAKVKLSKAEVARRKRAGVAVRRERAVRRRKRVA